MKLGTSKLFLDQQKQILKEFLLVEMFKIKFIDKQLPLQDLAVWLLWMQKNILWICKEKILANVGSR